MKQKKRATRKPMDKETLLKMTPEEISEFDVESLFSFGSEDMEGSENLDCFSCISCSFCSGCSRCLHCLSCIKCTDCAFCIGCYKCKNLKETKYCILNVQLTREEYDTKRKEILSTE